MFQNVQKKLTALYVLTSGIILTAALGITAAFLCQTISQQQEKMLLSNISHIISRLQISNRISDSWLADLEMQNQLIIRIEENNIPLLSRGNYSPATARDTLFAYADQMIDRNFQTEALIGKSYQSPVFTVCGDHGDKYLCSYLTLSVFDTFLSITVLNDTASMYIHLRFRLALLLLLEFLSLTALFFLGRVFVRRVMTPIRENEKQQQAFVSAASHELRTPITLIQGAADSILIFPEQTAYFQNLIHRECQRMTALIRDLLTLTSSNTAPTENEEFDAATLALELFETYQPFCETKEHPLLLELPEEFPPPCKSSPTAVSQILRIFLDNAIAYSPPEKPVTLRVNWSRNKIRFQVIDHGPGIPADQKELIFQRFYRSDSSRTDREHFGLGLSIAQKYASRIHGKILLEDTPGGGAAFLLELPLTPGIISLK